MEEFKESVRRGFQACKDDISVLKSENIELRDNNNVLSNDINKLTNEITELKNMINLMNENMNKNLQNTNSKNMNVNDYNSQLTENNVNELFVEDNIKEVKKKVKAKVEKDPYEALLAFKAKANKREMLKQKLTSMIGEAGMNLSELKFMFVEHFKYCSKATFYNYLKELEIEKIVRIERENSKNYVHLNSIKREI